MNSNQKQNTIARLAATNKGSAILNQTNLNKITGGSAAHTSIVIEEDSMFILEEITGL